MEIFLWNVEKPVKNGMQIRAVGKYYKIYLSTKYKVQIQTQSTVKFLYYEFT